MSTLSIESHDRFEPLSARVGELLWPYNNWFTITATEIVHGVELELSGDLGALAIEAGRFSYSTESAPRREKILLAPQRLPDRLVWRLPDVSMAPQRDPVEEVSFTSDVLSRMKKVHEIGEENFQRILSVAMNGTGISPGRGTLVLRARILGNPPESATEARLPFEITE